MARKKKKTEILKPLNKKLKPLKYKKDYREFIKTVEEGDSVKLEKFGAMTHEGREYIPIDGIVIEKLPKAVVLNNGMILPWWTIYSWEIL
jgi:hypothetical protein